MRSVVSLLLLGVFVSACGGGGSGSLDEGPGATVVTGVPTISGTPRGAVLYSDAYAFAPVASDPDGDALSFQVENRPPWTDFDPLTGTLSGVPGYDGIGVYDGIVISVSDGTSSASLPAFSISVVESAPGSIALQWQPPTANTDGSAVNNLAGYGIHYGRDTGAYQYQVRLDNPGVTNYVIENLLPGTYYIAATSYNEAGDESDFSGEIVVSVK